MSSSNVELSDWDAVETAERVRRGDVSAREVVEAAIARAEQAKDLGAIVEATYERALSGLSSIAPAAPFTPIHNATGAPSVLLELARELEATGLLVRPGARPPADLR